MVFNWIPFFSQTGSEIAEIIEITNIEPLIIITNKKTREYDERLKKFNILHFNSFNELLKLKKILNNNIITLHGFLKIIPQELITNNMYNGHPGFISKYPELKGFNPQEKAYNLKLETSGCVIHKVTQIVDSGTIIDEKEIDIKNLELDEIYKRLKKVSLELWIKFLNKNIVREI